jgi:hypothetical protein
VAAGPCVAWPALAVACAVPDAWARTDTGWARASVVGLEPNRTAVTGSATDTTRRPAGPLLSVALSNSSRVRPARSRWTEKGQRWTVVHLSFTAVFSSSSQFSSEKQNASFHPPPWALNCHPSLAVDHVVLRSPRPWSTEV